ncbi:septation ring formation regulator EzrA [Sporolactobacillus sp. CQH2019]|uniref:septation ring formation regulator EzrA n=1 Tax=Sporolactobacillus sp. CQH2019 TaxID=3023512 RepID=UPI002367973E|nr:septation ring formation regulator EzrA [Sporolactobacillus sp. CQH2019]MDD9149502.1 septation ring formation regulator EzrA [Sporolactobacillus sp. CQH2019]
MLYVIIGLILIGVIVIVYGAWMRKKMYGEIDRIETWRVELMNRPVAKEIAKVKKLKMVGDTEKKFEKSRSDWDRIITAELPAIEETLFNAEELTDKYRFKKAEKLIKALEEKRKGIEETIDHMLHDLNVVVDSESRNRKDVIPIKESYHQIKKNMITQRNQFRQALPFLEKSVREIDEQFKKYEEESDQGNYVEAREILLNVKKSVVSAQMRIERIPGLFEDLQRTIPNQLKELRQGKKEMTEQGYALDYLQLDSQTEEMEKQLHVLSEAVAKMELDEAQEGCKGIHDQLDWLYAQLEKEVLSRQQLHDLAPSIEKRLDRVGGKIKELADETETVRDSYHIDVEDLKARRDIGQAYQKLEGSFVETREVLNNHTEAFSSIIEKLEKMRADIEQVESLADEFGRKIKALRKDELAARETIQKLKHTLFESKRILRQSNLPGVPASFSDALAEAGNLLKAVNLKLDEKPLDMAGVRSALSQAQEKVDDVRGRADRLVETAALAEEMIRYGNRYRSEYEEIDRELKTAEKLFRDFDYQAAVETAVRAIEKKEPKILKRMDLYQDQERQM